MTLKNIPLTYHDGTQYNLQDYENFVILVVNTASECGLASQLEGLESLYQKYKDEDFIVLAFPSDQFKQEPLDNEQLQTAYQKEYKVHFPINQKVEINEKDTSPIFKWLKKEQSGVGSTIKWNFTKFLIDRKGNVAERFAPTTKPDAIEDSIKKLL